MKAFVLLILIMVIERKTGYSQSSEKGRRISFEPTAPIQTSGYKTPVDLVYVFPTTESPDDISRYAGTLNTRSSMTVSLSEFYTNTMWNAARDMRGGVKVLGAGYSSSAIDAISIYKPEGPVLSPSTESLTDGDFAALCLDNGQIVYAEINGGFSAANNTIRFLDKDKNGFTQIVLGWNAGTRFWIIKSGTTYPGLREGAIVRALYHYPEMNSEFYKRPAGSKGISLNTEQVPTKTPTHEEYSLNVEKNPSMAKIVFSDNKEFYANIIDRQPAEITIRLIPSGDVYTISKKGSILSGRGNYATGTRVKALLTKQAGESVYRKIRQANFNFGTLGFRFPDGIVQYAEGKTVNANYMLCYMPHLDFTYRMFYKNEVWIIESPGGEYREGTVLKDIFELEPVFSEFF